MNFLEDADESSAVDLNLTPLIDVVFLLLIFFMVSTTFVESRGISVTLPETKSTRKADETQNLVVSIKQDGSLYLGETKVSEGELRVHFEQKPEAALVIRADTKSEHGSVVKVMDLANQVGLKRIAVATSPRAS